ncbi:hypothetical protein, variant 1 [Verruconis gallopava]|uniref:TIGR02453 family protein n=1 Tax=Verruconis gallopava TaxID=253628 RepID=A0A0D2ARM9_9PEZI|nr:hypothetical protein, variant 1 [Verruconis gallopava]KIW09353.1 hypothetical protein, variant 1 [Verruconis gallopava]
MPRRSLRLSDVGAARSSSKRPKSSDGTSKSKRVKQQNVSKDAEEEVSDNLEDISGTEEDEKESGYEDSTGPDESEEESEQESSEGEPITRRSGSGAKRSFSRKASASAGGKGRPKAEKEIWRPGVKTGMGPGTQVVFKKPRARSPGDTPYTDETIHPNTMLFLKELAANNSRQWLKMHDPDYRASWKDFETFLEALTQGIITVDDTVPELPIKDIIFRIYRDVRFSKDQTPYKTHFSAAWSRTGRKGPYAVYYLQIKPDGGSLVGGGLWMPEAAALTALRQDIDRRPERIKSVLSSAGIRKEFLGGVAKDEAKVVKRFVNEHAETSLKTKPKGFDPDHKDIELLRLKNFTLHRKLRDEDVVSPNAVEIIVDLISHLVPFVSAQFFLRAGSGIGEAHFCTKPRPITLIVACFRSQD